ncbi:hypothetical protein [Haliangium sp.]|uniref:hypothetical protein n=1 Tax=Haliangium sp. TaxID=2663208 RepID=UPI003D134C25
MELLREPERGLCEHWARAFALSPLRAARPGVSEALAPLIVSLCETLALALAGDGVTSERPVPGAASLRELEKSVSFIGASQAGSGVSGFDVAASMLALRDVLVDAAPTQHELLRELFEWLVVLVLASFADASGVVVRERMSEHLERGTPVVLLAPRIPAVLLVGAPDARMLDSIFGRAAVLVVTQDAPVIIVDATGLEDPNASGVLDGLRRFAGHDKIAGAVEIVAVGLADEHASMWRGVIHGAGARLHRAPRFREAFEHALARVGKALVPIEDDGT